MDSISLGKLMDSLNVDRFAEEQLKLIHRHEKFCTMAIKIEYSFMIVYLLSSFYLYSNVNELLNILNILSLTCWFLFSIFRLFNRSILKWELEETLRRM